MLSMMRDGTHVVITPPLSEDERIRIFTKRLRSYLYDQSNSIEAEIRGRRPALQEAMQRGNREQVRAIQAMNRRSVGIE